MRPRNLARRLALQYLYMADVGGIDNVEPIEDFLSEHADNKGAAAFAEELVRLVMSQREEIDRILAAAVDNWELARIAPVELNLLRIGCGELKSGNVPERVAIDEAVELAKKFGSRESGGFVNGILDQVRKNIRDTEDTR